MDVTLPYRLTGSGQSVLVIHGAGSDGRLWARDLAPLSESHCVITYRRRGYALSSEPTTDWRVHGDDAAALIKALCRPPVAIVAHSAGSIAALDVAIKDPTLVSQIVLLDPAFRARRNLTIGLLVAYLQAMALRRVGRESAAVDAWLRYGYGYTTGGSAFDSFSAERREALRANAKGIFADIAAGDGSYITDAELDSIHAPTAIVLGELSPPFLQSSAAALSRALPNATLHTLAGSGHAMAFDQRDALIACLRAVMGQRPNERSRKSARASWTQGARKD
jgi:pimeloyl-ACP methyl ester carboxylesterase